MAEKLNPRHRMFAEFYMQSWNATEAARKAGYAEKSAAATACSILKRSEVKAYMRQRMEDQDSRIVADTNETLAFFTAVMRGEVKDQFGLDSALSDRLAAARELIKRHEGKLPPGGRQIPIVISGDESLED